MMIHNKERHHKRSTRFLISIFLPVGGEMTGKRLGFAMMDNRGNNLRPRQKMKRL